LSDGGPQNGSAIEVQRFMSVASEQLLAGKGVVDNTYGHECTGELDWTSPVCRVAASAPSAIASAIFVLSLRLNTIANSVSSCRSLPLLSWALRPSGFVRFSSSSRTSIYIAHTVPSPKYRGFCTVTSRLYPQAAAGETNRPTIEALRCRSVARVGARLVWRHHSNEDRRSLSHTAAVLA